MIKTIEQLLGGRYEYSVTPPVLSQERIDAVTQTDTDFRGSFEVTSADGQRLRGQGRVTNARIVLAHDRFTGKAFRVSFGIDVRGLRSGDEVRGEIVLTLNTGEIHVPIRLCVADEPVSSTAGVIRSVDDFAALARLDFREAYRIFSSGGLDPVMELEEGGIRALYRALRANPVTYQRMEEFLVASGRKEAVHFTADKNSEYFEHLTESAQGILRITKNTWGNVNLTVSAAESYISLPQKHFNEDDFVGNTLDLTYVILYEELGDGLQRGTIEIRSDTDRLELHVTATKHSTARSEERLSRKKAIAGICRDLIEFRLGRLDGTAFMKRCVPKIAAIRRFTGENIGLDLLEAACYEEIGANKAARDILRKWSSHDFGEEIASYEAAYLYLTSVLGMSDLNGQELIDEIRALFAEDEDSLIILMILARIDQDYVMRPGKLLTAMGRIYKNGSRSPFLFMEAAMVLHGNAHLLSALSSFTRSVLLFGLRYNMTDPDVALRAALLAGNEKTFTPAVYRILSESYRRYRMDDILEALCRLIIKGNPRREEFHRWYALAVERDIRITRLYEYYIETLPDNYRKPLPVKVRRYFTMNNTLGAGRRAMLFANIILNKSYDRQTYQEYVDKMSDFAREMLLRGSMNEDFAVVYSEFIPTLPTREMADAMARIMFRHVIVCDDPRIRDVVVVHDALKSESVYPVYHGRAYADLWSDDAVILFRDEYGKRFRSGVQYAKTKLIDYDSYVEPARRFGVREPGFLLYLLSGEEEIRSGDDQRLQECLYAASDDEFTDEFRRKLNGKLLEFFAAHREDDNIDLFLARSGPEQAACMNHTLLMEVMAMRGMAREAFTLACRYGYEDLEPGLFGKVVSRIIALRDYEQDEELVLAAFDCFRRGAADQKILIYLVTWYDGAIADMCAVRKAAEEAQVDTRVLEEKILSFSMFTRTPISDGSKIVRHYIREGGSSRVAEAYLNFEALRSFMESTPLDPEIAESLAESYDKDKSGSEICYLSLLRYYSDRNDLTEEEENRRNTIFYDAVRAGYLFSFYSKLPASLRESCQLDDKMIIECRALPSDKVIIRYRNSSENPDEEKEAPMRRMTGGIFARAFIMFSGEILRYRTVIIRGSERIESPEEACVMTSLENGGRSRYQRINRMIQEKRNGNYDSFREAERKYHLAVHVVRELFPLKNESGMTGGMRHE